MAGKSLLNQTSKKYKKDKYSEVSSIKKDYTYTLKDDVIYLGIVEDYKGLSCSIIKRSNRKSTEYYNVKFENGDDLDSVAVGFLKTPEEYEQWALDQENNDEQKDIPDIELEMIANGIVSYKNYRACLSPMNYYRMSCPECTYSKRCVYHKKGNYKKLDNS